MQHRTEQTIKDLIFVLWYQITGAHGARPDVKPRDGDWSNALSYEITRIDTGRSVRIWRRSLDDNDLTAVKEQLVLLSKGR